LFDEKIKNETEYSLNTMSDIPIWKRYTLTIAEAAVYYHIGENKLRQLADLYMHEDFILCNGNRVLIKKDKFERFLDESNTI